MYLNKFDFLNNAVGIKTAAKTYFSKDPKDLSIEEAATLIGMCKIHHYIIPVVSMNVHEDAATRCLIKCIRPVTSQKLSVILCKPYR